MTRARSGADKFPHFPTATQTILGFPNLHSQSSENTDWGITPQIDPGLIFPVLNRVRMNTTQQGKFGPRQFGYRP